MAFSILALGDSLVTVSGPMDFLFTQNVVVCGDRSLPQARYQITIFCRFPPPPEVAHLHGAYARATASSPHRVVYPGVLRSCFMLQAR